MAQPPTYESLGAALGGDLALVQQGVDWFAGQVRESVAGEPPIAGIACEAYELVLQRGGKRVRGVLTVAGYDMYGGENFEVASHAAGIVEGVHANLLVLDDVADRSDTRRGGPAAHVMIERGMRELGAEGSVGAVAMDVAVNTSVGIQGEIQVLLAELDVPAERSLSVISSVNRHLLRTGVGQVMDVFSTTGAPMTEADILKVAAYKTANYTFQLPLEVGALLAGGDDREFPRIEEYSQATGLAFQLSDDLIGVFGDEAKMGKSPKSDIIEAKQTYLMFHALREASEAEARMLRSALGNPDMTDEQFAACREIIERTGARTRTEKLAVQYADQAQEVLVDPPELWKPSRVNQLRAIASFVVARST